MSFLPVVERELRAAARRRSTYRVRWWTAVIAMLVSLVFSVFILAAGGGQSASQALFTVLTIFTGAMCLLTGVFLTADCLSEEKRDGTLGLLFLTDLKGYDVVLGKFMAMSVNALYGLLALLPVLALPLLLGGVTGGEFWRTTLALVNGLFFSLAAGIWVSALVRDARTAMSGTFGLLLALVAGLPLLAEVRGLGGFASVGGHAAWISPLVGFLYASEARFFGHAADFWSALAASHLFGWALLGSASWSLPRCWQERAATSHNQGFLGQLRRLGSGARARQTKRGARSLDVNPVQWLIPEEPILKIVVWAMVGGWGIIVLSGASLSSGDPLWIYQGAKLCAFLLKILVATQACRFFLECRRNGALELLLCTPLRNTDLLQGQWLALRRLFLAPLVVFVLLSLAPVIFRVYVAMSGPGWSQLGSAILGAIGGFMALGWVTIGLVMDFLALGWVGMWLGLSMKRPNLAPALTILLVLLLPSVAICGLDLGVDFVLILWASSKLHEDFRWVLEKQYQAPPAGFRGRVTAPGNRP